MPVFALKDLPHYETYPDCMKEPGCVIFDRPAFIYESRWSQRTRVYLAKNGRGMVKIGTSHHPASRVASLRVADPDIIMAFHFSAMLWDEYVLHQRFIHKHYRGEWFNLSDDDIYAIREYCRTICGDDIENVEDIYRPDFDPGYPEQEVGV